MTLPTLTLSRIAAATRSSLKRSSWAAWTSYFSHWGKRVADGGSSSSFVLCREWWQGVRLPRAIQFWNTALKEQEWLCVGNSFKKKYQENVSLLFILWFVQRFSILFLNTRSFAILYLVSPGRKEIGMFSWQPWPGCQLDLQAEQNSMSQALHWTSWGSCGLDSWSWQTAWQVEDGHQVRHGSKSTSAKGNKRTNFKGGYKTSLLQQCIPAEVDWQGIWRHTFSKEAF